MTKQIYLFILLLFIGNFTFSQTPQAFKYQAVVRDGNGGVLSNLLVALRISLLENNPTGTSVYTETHQPATNEFGIVTLSIGEGTAVFGNFSTISWGSATYFIKMELDITGNTNYEFMGTSQLLAVPYALYAKTSGSSSVDFDTDSLNELQTITKTGTTVTLSQGGGAFTDEDNQMLTLTGTQLSISKGNTIQLNDFDKDSINEIQTLSKTGSIISLSKDGNTIIDSDNQLLSISGTLLTISDGNSVQLNGTVDLDYDPTNEIQSLSITNDTLRISGSNTITLPHNFDNDSLNELQMLNFANDTLFLSKGNYVLLPHNSDNDSLNELQILSIKNDTIFLSKGNYVVLPKDFDTDSVNEIQSLNIKEDTLTLSAGNSIVIPETFDFSFPDGKKDLQPIFLDSLMSKFFKVPTGFNLYILNFYGDWGQDLDINNKTIVTGQSNSSTPENDFKIRLPIIVGSNDLISSNNSNNARVLGFLIKATITAITTDLKNTYTVPLGKNLYITNVFNQYGGNIYLNNKLILKGVSNRGRYQSTNGSNSSIEIPIIIKGGDILSTSAQYNNEVIINGYLK